MNQQTAVATYFTSLRLVNFRGFGEVDLNLCDEAGNVAQWTLLLGDNGVGKTTLLQALAWMRPVPVIEEGSGSDEGDGSGKEDASSTNMELEPIKHGQIACALTAEFNATIEGLFRIGAQDRFELVAKLWQGGKFGILPSPAADPHGKEISTNIIFRFKEGVLLDDPKGDNPKEVPLDIESELKEFWEPFIVSYGANRWTNPPAGSEAQLEDEFAERLSPRGTSLHDAQEELTALQGAVNEQHLEWIERNPNERLPTLHTVESRLLSTFKGVCLRLLPFATTDKDIEVRAQRIVKGETVKAQVLLRLQDQLIPFSQLSLGYQTVLTWALDLAWRLARQYSAYENPLEQPAIVLIDELDLHLHPRWQWMIMRVLSSLFPLTQFVATSHSPLMVQSMPNANFAIVEEIDGEIKIENSPEKVRGWRVDQILNSEYFDFEHVWDPESEKLFAERASLLEIANRSPDEERRLLELQQKISELPVATTAEDREAMEIIREAARILKANPPRE
jgi:energy-coupling factor transporter ATP-binding protein EcfA2